MKYINSKPIAILLATYNGDRYLADQLNSLIYQTNQDWTLYIRDDGSNDNTKEIISTYCTKYRNFINVIDNKGNLGCKNNFFHMMETIESKYYMFCDQDDIWLQDKVGLTLNHMVKLERRSTDKPIIVFTDLVIVDNQLNQISDSYWSYSRINPYILKNFNYLSVSNMVTGCTMMINRSAKELVLPVSIYALMHDSWIALKVTAVGGEVDFVSKATILYRQHENNVIGATQINMNYFVSKLRTINNAIILNWRNFLMVRSVRKTSIFVYIFYKILYLIKR